MRTDFSLPAGYIDADGAVHRDVELAPLSGREEELLSSSDYPTPVLVTELLARCIKRIGSVIEVTPALVRELLVADRQYLLLGLRQLTFGDRVQATLPCPWPGCGKGVDIDFQLSQIPVAPIQRLQRYYELEADDLSTAESLALGLQTEAKLQLRYRLPNGGDQEALLANTYPAEAEALSMLLSRCLQYGDEHKQPSPEWCAHLPARIRQQIEREMEIRAPALDLTMEARCPECEREFLAPFELQDFFFGELRINTDLLYREVHYLAFHYHWSEQEIMAMPRDRRRRYLEILSDEIEILNQQVE